MSTEDRLRTYLATSADDNPPHGRGADAVIAAARKRTRRRHVLLGSAAAVVLGLGLSVAWAQRADSPQQDDVATAPGAPEPAETEPAPAEPTAAPTPDTAEETPEADPPPPTSQADPSAEDEPPVEPASAPLPQGAVIETTAVADVIVAAGTESSGTTLWSSSDGESWAPLPGPPDISRSTSLSLAAEGDGLYVLGSDSATSPGWVAMSRADDLSSWDALELPVPSLPGEPTDTWMYKVTDVANVAPVMVVVGEAFLEIDLAARIPADVAASLPNDVTYELGGPTGDQLLAYNRDGSVAYQASFAELGIDPALVEYSIDGVPLLYRAVADDPPVWMDAAGLPRLREVAATSNRFIGIGPGDAGAGPAAWTSSDAVEWTRVELPALRGDRFVAIAARSEHVTVAGTSGTHPVVWESADAGSSWRVQDLVTGIDDGADPNWAYDIASFSANDQTAVLLIEGTHADGRASLWVAYSQAGAEWVVSDLADAIQGRSDGFEPTGVTLSRNGIVIIGDVIDPATGSLTTETVLFAE